MKIEDYGVLLNPLVVKGDCMLTADWHVPFEDKDWIEFMIKISKKWKVDKLIIAGDFFDQYSFAWTSGFKADRVIVAFKGEQKKSREMLLKLDDNFKKIYICMGGHDERLLKALRHQINAKDLFSIVLDKHCDLIDKKIFITSHNWIDIENKWRIYHPLTYSRKQLAKAERYWFKHPELHIISTHTHLNNFGFTASETPKIVWDLGIMADWKRIPWCALKEADYPAMRKGFGIIKDGYAYPFFEGNCDKKFWLK